MRRRKIYPSELTTEEKAFYAGFDKQVLRVDPYPAAVRAEIVALQQQVSALREALTRHREAHAGNIPSDQTMCICFLCNMADAALAHPPSAGGVSEGD